MSNDHLQVLRFDLIGDTVRVVTLDRSADKEVAPEFPIAEILPDAVLKAAIGKVALWMSAPERKTDAHAALEAKARAEAELAAATQSRIAAEQAQRQAEAAKAEAESAAAAAEQARVDAEGRQAALDAEVAAKRAQSAALDDELAAKLSRLAETGETPAIETPKGE